MVSYDKKQLFKYIGGGLIVAVAFAIMAPGLTNYVMGLGRLISLILTIISVAFLIVYICHKLKPKEGGPEPNYQEPTRDQDPTEPQQDDSAS